VKSTAAHVQLDWTKNERYAKFCTNWMVYL